MEHRCTPSASDGGCARSIVVVDGDRRVRSALRAVLEAFNAGWSVRADQDVASAVRSVGEFFPDLALVDVTAPGADEAHGLVARLRAGGTSVVAMSTRDADRSIALANGAHAFVTKGVDPDTVVTLVRSLVDVVQARADPPPRPTVERTAMPTTTIPSSSIDLWTDDALRDPYPLYDELRELGPVVHLERNDAYAIARYEPLRAALGDWESFSSARGVMMNDHVNESFTGIVLCTDPPEHDVMRKVLAAPLRPDQLRVITPGVRAEADAVVEAVVAAGRFDAATDLAQHLPLTVVSRLVGLGDFGRERMLEWAAAIFDAQGPLNARTRAAFSGLDEMVSYATTRATPGNLAPDGWSARLFTAADRGEISHEQASKMIMDYTGPALDTTIFAIGSAVKLFAQHPDQWDLVRADPGLIPHAINEVVRLESPIQRFSRVTTGPVDVGGTGLPGGVRVLMLFGAGNRDHRHYDDPTRFDVRRKPSDHLAFGHGVHACVGMNLARLEIRLLLEALAQKVERFEVVSEERAMNNTLRGLSSLVVSVR